MHSTSAISGVVLGDFLINQSHLNAAVYRPAVLRLCGSAPFGYAADRVHGGRAQMRPRRRCAHAGGESVRPAGARDDYYGLRRLPFHVLVLCSAERWHAVARLGPARE